MNDNNETTSGAIDYWVVSDRVLILENGEATERPLSIGVSGSRISIVLDAGALRAGPLKDRAERAGQEVIDVGFQPVVPGFVNAHTHLALAPLRGVASLKNRAGNVVSDVFFQVEKHLTSADVQVFTRLGALEGLLHGVSEVWDHYYYGEAVADALLEAGVTGVVAPTLQDLSGPGAGSFEGQLDATLRIRDSYACQRGGVRAALGPHASDTVSNALFTQIAQLARTSQLPVHMHLAQSFSEMEAAQGRFEQGLASAMEDALGGCRVLMAHGLFLTAADCDKLASLGWVLGYCPNSQLQFGFLSPFGAWVSAGGDWALGTDCVASNDALDVQRELPLVGGEAALAASFSEERRALLSTYEPRGAGKVEVARTRLLSDFRVGEPSHLLARAWGHSLRVLEPQEVRGFEPGALASFLVLKSDHPSLFPGDDLARSLAYGSTAGAIDWSVVAGSVRGRRDGLAREVLASEVYRDTVSEARRRRDELFERAQMKAARPPS